MARIPDVFIAGAPRCGTTSLHDLLGQHPDVYMSPAKEVHFFGSDLHHRGRPPLSEAAYLANFAGARDERRVGEASTSYFYSERAAAEIREFSPDAHVILMLRNPVEMMYSLYNLYRVTGVEEHPSFEAALDAEPRRREGLDLPDRPVLVEGLFYRQVARLSEHVGRFFETFGRERVHVIVFDDFVADVQSAYAGTLRFLEVDDGFRPEFRARNAATEPRIRGLHEFVLRPPPLVRRVGAAVVPHATRDAVSRGIRRLNAVPRKPPPLDPALRRRLQQELAAEVAALGELLDRDLSHWR
jgi:Sulfotransferase family